MLTLYHYWSSVCSQKVRMCLAEKGLAFESRHVDIFAFENYEPTYTRLNPKAVVPTLDHDGNILIESNIILEYLEDVFPNEVRLRPNDPFARSTMRLWIYNSEELAHWNVNVCSHNLRHAKRMDQRYSHEEQMAAAMKCPNPMIALRLKRRLAVGVSVEEEDEAYAKLDYLLDQMEQRLGHGPGHGPWLAGPMFTLVDIAMAPMINRIEVLARPEMIAAQRRPRVAAWWQRIQARPGYQTAFSFKPRWQRSSQTLGLGTRGWRSHFHKRRSKTGRRHRAHQPAGIT